MQHGDFKVPVRLLEMDFIVVHPQMYVNPVFCRNQELNDFDNNLVSSWNCLYETEWYYIVSSSLTLLKNI